MPTYLIDMTEDAYEDLSYYRVFERKRITDEMVRQLRDQPMQASASRKYLRENRIAQWELKVGKYRVFYEIDPHAHIVTIVSVGHKEHNVLYIRGKVVRP